jgi:hypothetical protein
MDTSQNFPPYPQGSGSSGVISLNSLSGALTLTSSDSSVTITPSGSTIDLQATGGGSEVTSLNSLTGVIAITSPNGTLSIGTSGSDVTVDVNAPLPVAYGGTGTTSPSLVAGSGITVTGPWPDQTITATGSAPSFSAITSGTNTTATMNVGPGGVLTFSGSGSPPSEGEINANFIYGVQISGTAPTSGQVLTATSSTSANWQTPSGGGGGVTSLNSLTGALNLTSSDSSVTITPSGSTINLQASGGGSTYPVVGTPILPGNRPGSQTNGFNGYTIWAQIPGSFLGILAATWKAVFACVGRTGLSVAAAACIRTLPNSLAVVDSTTITFSGSPTYDAAFGTTPTTTAPAFITSDAMSLQLDTGHDYWIGYYLNSDSNGYNASLVLGINPPAGCLNFFGQYEGGGNHLSDNPLNTTPYDGQQPGFWEFLFES